MRAAFEGSGLLDEGGFCAKANLKMIETGRPYFGALSRYARELARREGHPDDQDIPSDIWRAADEAWDWLI